MNVKTVLAVACLLALPLAAQLPNEHAHGAPAAPQTGQAQAPGPAMEMGCMNMHEHMQAMQKRMDAMQQHMDTMQQHMDHMERERGTRRR
jgi:hypothetical protein